MAVVVGLLWANIRPAMSGGNMVKLVLGLLVVLLLVDIGARIWGGVQDGRLHCWVENPLIDFSIPWKGGA